MSVRPSSASTLVLGKMTFDLDFCMQMDHDFSSVGLKIEVTLKVKVKG